MLIVNKSNSNATKNLRYSNNSLVFDTTYPTLLKYVIQVHTTLSNREVDTIQIWKDKGFTS